MSQDNNGKKTGLKTNMSIPPVKGPPKPWEPEMEAAAEDFVNFLKDPDNKQEFKEFIWETFKRREAEKINQLKARVANEEQVNDQRLAPYHETGNITPAMADILSMNDSERAFIRGIGATKKHLVKSLEDRADEINRLLSGIGGFSSHIKACFARSTVVFLEQEDPRYNYRERLIFSINLPNFELKRTWKKTTKDGKQVVTAPNEDPDDPRNPVQATWDDAVNTLAKIIETSGLKPKYCKNDRNYGRFVIKQDLRHSSILPDEYFSFTLDYNTEERISEMSDSYNKIIRNYDAKINRLQRKLRHYTQNSTSTRYAKLRRKFLELVQEKDFFIGTVPDPSHLDEGLLFLIEVSTLKDYYIVRDRMQSIMTKFILHLSKIAAREAEFNPDLEYERWKMGQTAGPGHGGGGGKGRAQINGHGAKNATQADLSNVPEYEIDAASLQRVNKKKAA